MKAAAPFEIGTHLKVVLDEGDVLVPQAMEVADRLTHGPRMVTPHQIRLDRQGAVEQHHWYLHLCDHLLQSDILL